MDFNKIKNDNGFYLYQDDSFSTIFLQMCFLREKGNFEDAVFDILCRYLTKINKKYNTEYDLNKKVTDLYSVDFGFSAVNIGSQALLFYSADIVSPSIIHDDYSKEVFEFLKDILTDPDFTHEEIFENTKRTYLSSLLNAISQPNIIARNLFNRTVLNKDYEEYRYSTDEEYIRNMINSITLKDLEDLYNKTIKEENFVRGVVFGNITDKEYRKLRENFNYKSDKEPLDYSIDYKLKRKNYEVVSDTTSESVIYITYSFDDISEGVRSILDDIFNGSSDLCMELLREKYGLVYASNVNLSYTGKFLVVRAKIDKNNKDKFIKAVDEMIGIVKDKNKLKDLLETSKRSIKNDYYLLSENRDRMINKIDDYVAKIFKDFDEPTFAKEIDNVKVEDVIKYTKTLKRKNIFMYRGDGNE